jgi:5-methylcytosine-specific restriction endonuclease McrA
MNITKEKIQRKVMNCQICDTHEAEVKDYRFINSCGLQGKVLSCTYCNGLNDDAICEIIRDELDPKDFYNEEDS